MIKQKPKNCPNCESANIQVLSAFGDTPTDTKFTVKCMDCSVIGHPTISANSAITMWENGGYRLPTVQHPPPTFKRRMAIKLRDYLNKKIHRQYMDYHRCDSACVNCQRRESEIINNGKNVYLEETSFGYSWFCEYCLTTSYYNTVAAPIPLSCDREGNPY